MSNRPNITKLPIEFFMNANDWLDEIADNAISIDDRDELREYLKSKFEELFSLIK